MTKNNGESNGESGGVMEMLRAYWWAIAAAVVIAGASIAYYALGGSDGAAEVAVVDAKAVDAPDHKKVQAKKKKQSSTSKKCNDMCDVLVRSKWLRTKPQVAGGLGIGFGLSLTMFLGIGAWMFGIGGVDADWATKSNVATGAGKFVCVLFVLGALTAFTVFVFSCGLVHHDNVHMKNEKKAKKNEKKAKKNEKKAKKNEKKAKKNEK